MSLQAFRARARPRNGSGMHASACISFAAILMQVLGFGALEPVSSTQTHGFLGQIFIFFYFDLSLLANLLFLLSRLQLLCCSTIASLLEDEEEELAFCDHTITSQTTILHTTGPSGHAILSGLPLLRPPDWMCKSLRIGWHLLTILSICQNADYPMGQSSARIF